MTAMTLLPHLGDWTVDDLATLPDDGLQYELVDGVLLVSPAPRPRHQRALKRLLVLLDAHCPAELEVYPSPLDFQPTRRRSLQPDVLVVRRSDMGELNLQRAPLLAVEVLSPSTRAKDLVLKRAVYAESGVPSYWVVDPEVPSLTVFTLRDDQYDETATVTDAQVFAATEPYPVRVAPVDLVRD